MEQKLDAEKEVRQGLQTMRVIVFALTSGVALFVGYAAVFARPEEPKDATMFGVYMAVFAGMAVLLRLFVPGLVYRAIRRQIAAGTWQPSGKHSVPVPKTDEGQLMAAFQTKTIIGAALLEAAGLANAFAYMTERQLFSLVITLVLILGIAMHFPLSIDSWLEQQKRWLAEERSMPGFQK